MYIKLYVISFMSILKVVIIPQKETRQSNIKKFLVYQLYKFHPTRFQLMQSWCQSAQ